MKIIKTKKYSQTANTANERRYHGSIEMKIFVPKTNDENEDYSNASNILLNALKVLSENNIDANFGSLVPVEW